MDRFGILKKDPYLRQVQKIRFERNLKVALVLVVGASMTYASMPDTKLLNEK